MLPDIQPGNTKILYFFNCLLDGMHTKITYICDFSRGGLNARLYALASNTLLRGHKYSFFYLLWAVLWMGKKKCNLFWNNFQIRRRIVFDS